MKWKIPEAYDNDGYEPKLMTNPPNIIPPRTFPIGDHKFQYIAIDRSGLKSSCPVYIRVLGNSLISFLLLSSIKAVLKSNYQL